MTQVFCVDLSAGNFSPDAGAAVRVQAAGRWSDHATGKSGFHRHNHEWNPRVRFGQRQQAQVSDGFRAVVTSL
jgi:hypothetical protein